MQSRIIILNGSGGSGKDTFVNCVEKYINTYHYSSVAKIKEIATSMGWNGGKSETDRQFLCDLKLLSTKYNNLPFDEISKTVDRFILCNPKDSLLFIDVREPNEIALAVKKFNTVSILITNQNVEHIASNMADKNVLEYDYDYIIKNDGSIDDLETIAKEYVEMYKRGEI